MTLDLDSIYIEETHTAEVQINTAISQDWIDALFQLKNTTNEVHKKIVPSMYAAIPKDVISASIIYEGKCIGTGLGILDRDYIGIYAIHVDELFRRKGYAHAIVSTLLYEGKKAGASRAYLQVVADNHSAKHLYRKIGFRKLYSYWFRVK
jgi:ribosomal protein S18 acetylase RimI-like enzyme